MTEERKKEILKTIEERISSIPEEYVSKVVADWFFCSGEEDLMEVAKSIKRKDSDLSQHMRDWYVKTRGCTKTEMAIVLTDPEFMLTSSLKDKILSRSSIRLMQSDNFKKKSLYDKLMNVYVPSKTLRRPISVCDSENGVLRLVYQVKGEGTKIMSEMKKGESVDILAPLGNGFKIEKGKRYCLIGGGIGVPPMLYTAKQCENPLVITGFRNKDLIILQDDFKKAGAELVLTTDDGSAGIHGFVTDVLKEKISEVEIGRAHV